MDYIGGSMLQRLLCFLALVLVPACKDSGNDGRCVASSDCKDGQGCYQLPTGSQRCLARCDATTVVLCAGGELCVSVPGEDAADDVCLPGGSIPVGAACDTSAQCAKGAMCFASAGVSTCRRACEVAGAPTCQSNETCASLDPDAGLARGVCAVTP
jgi:hypothetical protein